MAIDEHLLALHGPSGSPVLRLYGWSPPAITLGRYQDAECVDRAACADDGIDVVRRITGGGAIFHDNEMTYSVVWPDEGLERPGGIDRAFETINAFMLETYRALGLDPAYAKDIAPREHSSGRPQFCFSGNENYDILVTGKKIGGNAQRRTGGALLQHGSIPLTIEGSRIKRYFRDRIETRNFTSLHSACGRDVSVEELTVIMTSSFTRAMGIELAENDLDSSEEVSVRALIDSRYSRDEWNYSVTEGQQQ